MKSSVPPPLDGLYELACRDGVDIRSTLLRVTTDLYVQKPVHSAEEETQYVELALGLIAAADEATRAAVAASLSTYPNAPAAVREKLGTKAAAPVAPAAPAPATRTPTSATPAPARRADDRVAMFFAAAADERRLILTTLDLVDGPAARQPKAAPGTASRLEAAAMQRNLGEFGRTLAGALGIDAALAARIAADHSGEPIVVAAKALGLHAAVLQRILLFINPAIGQSVDRIFDLARLFDEIRPEAAARMLAIWQGEGRAAKPQHQSVYYDDERRAARAAPSARERSGRSRDEQPLRGRSSGR
ncbi:MAG: DUF2336 domain-containing protein [Pseudolabrys sp.]|nr:DUF2336 domain-containing protein [Pseudolabrys sp.]